MLFQPNNQVLSHVPILQGEFNPTPLLDLVLVDDPVFVDVHPVLGQKWVVHFDVVAAQLVQEFMYVDGVVTV